MFNSNNSIRKILKGYVKWLNRSYFYKVGDNLKKFKSGLSYANYMEMAILDLGIKPQDFVEYSQPGLLKSFATKLESSAQFLRREAKIQSDILSAFNAYIKYIAAVTK
tara:strand:+ start:8424 stop:8747 length:324 start_codon:yes stop_codon:yes gene_type:complete